MADVTIAQFADVLKVPVDRLIAQQDGIWLFELLHEQLVRAQTIRHDDGLETRFHQILLVGGDHDAAELVHDGADIVKCRRRQVHGDVLGPSSEAALGPIASSGRTSSTRLVATAAPGMPHTTLVASSWAITLPPEAAISAAPRAPSDPMPVKTSARLEEPHTCSAEDRNGSTDGLQKLTGGPSPSAITASTP